jgi:hypothetical protein
MLQYCLWARPEALPAFTSFLTLFFSSFTRTFAHIMHFMTHLAPPTVTIRKSSS